MTDFLDTLPFLSESTRAALREDGYDDCDSIAARDPAYFEKEYKLKAGIAGKLYTAACRAAGLIGAPAATGPVQTAPLGREDLIGLALREDPPRSSRLTELGVAWFVEDGSSGSVDPEATEDMRRSCGDARPAGDAPVWKGQRVLSVSSLDEPTWVQPRSGEPLQGRGAAGVDRVTGDRWGELGEDGIRCALVGEQEGFFRGMTDAAVIEAMRLSSVGNRSELRAKVEAHMRLTNRTAVDVRAGAASAASAAARALPAVWTTRSIDASQRGFRELLELLGQLFSSPDELRRFLVARVPDGQRVADNVSWGGAPASVTYAALDILRRWGLIQDALCVELSNAVPSRAAEVRDVFRRLEVK